MTMAGTKHSLTPGLGRALLVGARDFGLVSLCAFSTVSLAERWMHARQGGI